MSANRMRMLLVLAFMAFALPAAAQSGSISGKVTDDGGRPVPGARVHAAQGISTSAVAVSNENGDFRLGNLAPGTYVLTATRIGMRLTRVENVVVGAGASATANIAMPRAPLQLEQIITTVGREPEKALDAPANVAVITSEQVNERAAVSVADHVAALPGIDVARGGLMRANIVARGFNNIFSGALMTLTDYRFAFVPSLRVNIPYLSTTTNEDIDRIEVVLGPAAALYGPNTASGVMALFTKSPFASQGTTVTIDGGNQSVLRGSLRTAWAPNQKLGFKLSYDAFKGREWDFCDGKGFADKDSPCYNIPADTVGEQKPRERDINRQGGEVRVDFRPTPSSEIIANYGRSQAGSAVEPTGLGPAQVKDWVYQTYQLRGRYNRLFGQVFVNTSDAGGTYLLQKVRSSTNCPDPTDDACIIDKSYQIAAQAQHGLNFGLRQRFLYGVDYVHTIPTARSTAPTKMTTRSPRLADTCIR
ncbi:MAG: carboxypeptidase regulatory-like domain-containing protein [Gemmatimonadales bacterium]